ncbi:hypothetical protein [Escherichia albertii]|uniref:hypothetical protein n=1 Tax=Escherichia albertii TaxID=208962 RepID=UPI00211A1D34|nr:hypothetical protein [Escherichia albertii]UUL16856.1 hypothetical protein NIZ14_23670 [Escherichia albertii]
MSYSAQTGSHLSRVCWKLTNQQFVAGSQEKHARQSQLPTKKLPGAIEKKFQEAVAFASADKVSGDSIDVATIERIVDSYKYADEQERKSAIDAVNNAICETTYLSNLYQIAQNIARGYRGY